MLIQENQTFEEIIKSLHQEIKRGVVDKKHPFRYVVLGTSDQMPFVRYVVVREVLNSFDLVLYTDNRSAKVAQIQANKKVEVLLYHPRRQCQIRISGHADIHQSDGTSERHWNHVQGKGQLSYNTEYAPGTPVSTPEEGARFRSQISDKNFSVIHVHAQAVDVLQLGGETHLRCLLTSAEEKNWKGEWLVP